MLIKYHGGLYLLMPSFFLNMAMAIQMNGSEKPNSPKKKSEQ